MFVVPTMLPAAKTIRTKASHPQNAFLRCRPLQCAMRAARLCFEDEVDMSTPHGCVRRRPLWMAPCTGQMLEPEDSPAACFGADHHDHTPVRQVLPAP